VPLEEKALVAQVRRIAKRGKNPLVRTAIGDDCAVLQLSPNPHTKSDALVTTDFSLEGIHFKRDWHSPETIGHRCLARGLSDIAAMGGTPVAAFLSLALPHDVTQSWVNRFTRALLDLAAKYGVTLAGGDTAESPAGILADIVLVGSAPEGQAVLRSGARPGNIIYVTGELGGSAAAVAEMRQKSRRKPDPRKYRRHFSPEPRIEVGRFLREKKLVTAMIDTSDGLSSDLAHICEESRVGAELQSEAIPRARVGHATRTVSLAIALHGGEDYELLFTAAANQRIPSRIAGVSITPIGRITRARKMVLINRGGIRGELKPQGWEHFRKRQ
jgi:thiamine-monophosphate kinase